MDARHLPAATLAAASLTSTTFASSLAATTHAIAATSLASAAMRRGFPNRDIHRSSHLISQCRATQRPHRRWHRLHSLRVGLPHALWQRLGPAH